VTALDRVAVQLARYRCDGPIPIVLSASARPDGTIAISATATVTDVDAWRATGARVATTVICSAVAVPGESDAALHARVVRLVEQLHEHEAGEWLELDGAPVRDPHRGRP